MMQDVIVMHAKLPTLYLDLMHQFALLLSLCGLMLDILVTKFVYSCKTSYPFLSRLRISDKHVNGSWRMIQKIHNLVKYCILFLEYFGPCKMIFISTQKAPLVLLWLRGYRWTQMNTQHITYMGTRFNSWKQIYGDFGLAKCKEHGLMGLKVKCNSIGVTPK